MSGWISSQKGWLGTGTGCPGVGSHRVAIPGGILEMCGHGP